MKKQIKKIKLNKLTISELDDNFAVKVIGGFGNGDKLPSFGGGNGGTLGTV